MIIQNASNKKLSQNTGTLPDMSSALLDWFQSMVFEIITKSVVNFKNSEIAQKVQFQGVMQSFTDRQLEIKPEGQRSWKWQMLHSDTTLILKNDDVVLYRGLRYRVMSNMDYSPYGYLEYHLAQDFRK